MAVHEFPTSGRVAAREKMGSTDQRRGLIPPSPPNSAVVSGGVLPRPPAPGENTEEEVLNAENMNLGYVGIFRSLLSHPILNELPGDYLKVFIYCLLRASYQSKTIRVGRRDIPLEVGSFVASSDRIASDLNLSRGKVRRVLELLAKEDMVVVKAASKFSCYHVVNYACYQNKVVEIGQQKASKRPAVGQQVATNKKVNNTEEKKKEPQKLCATPPDLVAAMLAACSETFPATDETFACRLVSVGLGVRPGWTAKEIPVHVRLATFRGQQTAAGYLKTLPNVLKALAARESQMNLFVAAQFPETHVVSTLSDEEIAARDRERLARRMA